MTQKPEPRDAPELSRRLQSSSEQRGNAVDSRYPKLRIYFPNKQMRPAVPEIVITRHGVHNGCTSLHSTAKPPRQTPTPEKRGPPFQENAPQATASLPHWPTNRSRCISQSNTATARLTCPKSLLKDARSDYLQRLTDPEASEVGSCKSKNAQSSSYC